MKLIVIIKKEILDQVRDRRTLIAAILLPAVIVPSLLFMASRNTPGGELNSPVRIILPENELYLKSIILGSFRDTMFIDPDTPSASVINGKADLQITVSNPGERNKTINLIYDPARRSSALSYIRINDLLKSYISSSEAPENGVEITASAIRSENENKTLITLALILPVFLMIFAASSAMSGAIDMSSGEKERSTIEILLSCNIAHSAIITGKILAASIIGLTAIVSLLSGLIFSSHLFPEITGGISLFAFCGILNLFILLAMTAVSVFLFSSAGMVIGLYAKSVKEGTILTLPVIIISSAMSGGLIACDPFKINLLYLFIPVLNFSCLMRSVIFNHHDYLLIMISIFINLAYASLFIFLSSRLLKKESVIFRS